MPEKELIRRLVKKRLLLSILNFFLFFYSFQLLDYVVLKAFGSQRIDLPLIAFFVVVAIWYIFYFGIFVKLTNGYTLAGLLLRVKTIKLDGSKIDMIECLKRAIYSLFSNIKFFIFMVFSSLEMNSLGQMKFDKAYHVTMIDSSNDKEVSYKPDEVVTYRFTYYDFITEIIKIWGLFFSILIGSIIIENLFQ